MDAPMGLTEDKESLTESAFAIPLEPRAKTVPCGWERWRSRCGSGVDTLHPIGNL